MSEHGLSRAEVLVLSFLLDQTTPVRQIHIADETGVTQARVSQILGGTDADGWTERSADGWSARRLGELFERLATARAPRTEAVDRWYSLDNGQRQIELAMDQAAAQNVSLRVGGDWAADRIAPWRIPGLVVLHCDAHLDLEPAGFVPIEDDRSEATTEVRVGRIPPGWRCDIAFAGALGGPHAQAWPLAPITEVAREILAAGGPDAADAVAELEQRFLSARAHLGGAA
ncbi:MarR family transcriptional regulator [Nocardia sp. NPDC052566]|uniref:MarR family transcriptional regulator n=1 Tax=Nocardia sp. NPDC052566 TaxID=3364330 RepID=UPI0037C8B8AB